MSEYDVFVVGSANVDQTVTVERMPEEGETLKGLSYQICCGGKGSNQAVGAARAKAKTAFLGCVGNDDNGKLFRDKFAQEGIICDAMWDVDTPTGVALIYLTTSGNNAITIYAGANGCISSEQIEKSTEMLNASKVVLLQNEVPEEVNIQVAKAVTSEDTKVILNPAPAREMSTELLAKTDCIIPNETEAQLITGIKITDQESLDKCVDKLHELGIDEAIITLGERGCYVSSGGNRRQITPPKVKAINTIGAGDCFCGVFCAFLAKGFDTFAAVEYAVKASSISVTRHGAMDSMPMLDEFYTE
ncbi:MAG: ribokinase [Sedimentisphaeraceae bacterium JB056]